MALFGNFFNKNSNTEKDGNNDIPWITLNNPDQLEEIVAKSKNKPQAIFKHSTTCGVSRMVLNMFNASFSLEPSQMDLYFLDLHAFRAISNEIAERFEVLHQSPQLLIIKNGVVVAHSSHGGISDISLEKYV
ncbi:MULTISPECIES: bacillithiol system redox-active protein YtxJ [Maribacter]|uniref:Bacillithiol system redox-active protein YtxJ n=1 Tax=Maribacter flavus TaxID=1658664 RepID=A0A5B2TR04_9FLAO|nr:MULTISPECIES: bacillithiol system redox-active protein YtxJ [Maribacter]KAA2217051.1 bacillithiol system redox-active protein YtxJ [Maribacter flavus]MDC6405548.1 bacillithiol system redox-active protein YtxJ [Maribacter sp. PR66]MEE1972684.1 bacillithiol system redox-active protein YtxJ [Maribacter flavus]